MRTIFPNMRAFLTFAAIVLGGFLLVLWFSRSPAPSPLAPTPASPLADASSKVPEREQTLSPADDAQAPARIAEPASSKSSATTAPSGPRCRVFGRVVDEHNAPLADVQVRIYPVGGRWSETTPIGLVGAEGAKHEGFVQRSASDGRFDFQAPLPTADWVSLEAEGDLYRSLVERRFGPGSYSKNPRLSEGDNDVGDLRLVPCGAVRGRVVSAKGGPISDAWVGIPEADPSGRQVNTRVDERGEFVLGHASAGTHAIEVHSAGWITAEKKGLEIVALQTIAIPDIVLTPAFAISGNAVDEKGQPAARVIVRANMGNGRGSSARTNEAGEFVVYTEAEGTCTLAVPDSPDFEAWGGADSTFDTGEKNVRIVLHRKGDFTFHVVDAHTRAPIERFGLRLDPKPIRDSQSGSVDRAIPLADHPHGEARVHKGEYVVVWAPGLAPFEGDVVPDANDSAAQTIELRAPSAIRGRAMLARKACPKCTLSLWREGIDEKGEFRQPPGAFRGGLRYDVGGWSGRKRDVQSGDDGTFTFGDLAPGTYALQIEGAGAARKRLRGLVVPAENALELGDVVLEPGAVVRGVLVCEPGASPEGFHVRLGFDWSRATTIDNVDGKFEFQGLEAGEYKLSWGRPAQTSWSSNDPHIQTITLGAGEVREVLIDASASTPCAVIVHVTRGGRPAEGITIGVRVQSPGKNGWTGAKLGQCDAGGTAAGEVDGDALFDLQAVTESWDPICTLASGVQAEPGGRIERTLEMKAGRLTVELPPTIEVPEQGLLRVVLEAPGEEQLTATATTAGAPRMYRGGVVWSGRTIACGEFGAGTYDAVVHVQRLDPDPEHAGRTKPVDLREPYKTKVVIEADHEAKIVVP